MNAEETSAAIDEAYDRGAEAEKGNLFTIMIIWGGICGVAGYIVAFAVMA